GFLVASILCAAAGEHLSIGTESYRINSRGVRIEGAQQFARRAIPQFNCSVFTATGDDFAVRTECDGINWTTVTFETSQLCAGAGVPHLNRSFAAGAGKQFPVG